MLTPQRPGELWFGGRNPEASTTALLSSVGARDLSVGLGLVAEPGADSLWLKAGIVADVVDATAAVLASRRIPVKNVLIGFGGAAAYTVIGCLILLNGRRATAEA